jgi:hypothetical protein
MPFCRAIIGCTKALCSTLAIYDIIVSGTGKTKSGKIKMTHLSHQGRQKALEKKKEKEGYPNKTPKLVKIKGIRITHQNLLKEKVPE